MVGTQQAKPAKCAAADFRINRIAKPTSSRNKPILTHTTKGRLITTECIRRLKEQESRRCPLAAFPILTARNNGRYSPTQPLTIKAEEGVHAATRQPAATAAGHCPRAHATVPLRGRCNRGSSAQHPAVWSAVAGKPSWLPYGTPFPTPPNRIPTSA
jgi:hypothetical protein